MALTAKQAQFVHEYLVDLNATQAAIRAGYSKATANEQAARLMRNPEIEAAIEAAKSERAELTKITAAWVLRRLVDETQADLADLYDAETGALLPIEQWPLIWRQGLVQGVDISVERDGDGREIAVVKKIRVSDRVRRLELIGKHIDVSAFAENIKHQVTDGLAERLERARERAREGECAARPVTHPSPVPIAPPEPAAEPAQAIEPPAGPSAPVAEPKPSSAAEAAIIGAPPAYTPLWPEPIAQASVDYDLLGSWNLD